MSELAASVGGDRLGRPPRPAMLDLTTFLEMFNRAAPLPDAEDRTREILRQHGARAFLATSPGSAHRKRKV
jgi:hypothetical protein